VYCQVLCAGRGILGLQPQYRLLLVYFAKLINETGNLFESLRKCSQHTNKNSTHRSGCLFFTRAPGWIRSRVTKYNHSLRSNSIKYSRPRLARLMTSLRLSNPDEMCAGTFLPAHEQKWHPKGCSVLYSCAGLDSNQRRHMPTDLQSVVIDHSTTDADMCL